MKIFHKHFRFEDVKNVLVWQGGEKGGVHGQGKAGDDYPGRNVEHIDSNRHICYTVMYISITVETGGVRLG